MIKVSNSLKETKEIAIGFLGGVKKSNQATVIGLRGDLGSGKTTFTKAVAEHLGLEQTVSSPTFVIEKIYKLESQDFKHLIHIDAYRLQNGKELLTLGWEEVIKDPQNLIFIEWPENVSDVLPKNINYIDFKFINEDTREISF